MFFLSLVIIFVVSLLLAVGSLLKELHKSEEKKAEEVQKILSKGRVIFYSPSSDSSKF